MNRFNYHFKKVNIRSILMVLLAVVILLALILVYFAEKKNEYATESSEMIAKAEYFWGKGESERAVTQMKIYLDNNKSDIDAWFVLAGYYDQLGNDKKVQDCYRSISLIDDANEGSNEDIVLSGKKPAAYFDNGLKDFIIEIKSKYVQTSEITMTVLTNCLNNGLTHRGSIQNSSEDLDTSESITTEWFYLDSEYNDFLNMSGSFNSSIWQFKNANGDIVESITNEDNFNNLESRYTGNKISSTVQIPKDAVQARVTYWSDKEDTVGADIISIVPGNYPQNNGKVKEYKITIPVLNAGDSITYDSKMKSWIKKSSNGVETELPDLKDVQIEDNSIVSISGNVCPKVYMKTESKISNSNQKAYGVKWRLNSNNPICERVGLSSNYNYGYYSGNQWFGTGSENDFDKVRPWSDIKLCAIDENGKIIYDNFDKSYDIMVEIPKFYYKREIVDGYEYVWISDKMIDGFRIDPAFETKDGVVDYVYVAAYLSNVNEDGLIGSNSGRTPAINYSLDDVKELIKNKKGDKWQSLDLVTLSMIQKLFLVETACRDSQALFMGVTNLSWASCYAISDIEASNSIILENNDSSKKISVGDSVTVFRVPKNTNYYDILVKYENKPEWTRTVESVSKNDDGTITITFSGDNINIVKGESLIMNLPNINGEADSVDYHTGQVIYDNDGRTSFKYRYLENIWGSVCTMLDGAYVQNCNITVKYPNGKQNILSYKLAAQTGTTSEGVSPSLSSIKTMGYDIDNSSIMLPSEVGNGASAVTYWCDSLFYKPTDEKQIITYGLTWDLRQYAGLFSYRVNINETIPKVESGSRLIFR